MSVKKENSVKQSSDDYKVAFNIDISYFRFNIKENMESFSTCYSKDIIWK